LRKEDGIMVCALNVGNLGDISLVIKKKEYICVIIHITVILDVVKIIGKYSRGELKMFSSFFLPFYISSLIYLKNTLNTNT
jgi:hypothetical protein